MDNRVIAALKTLISGVQIAQSQGTYNLKDASSIYESVVVIQNDLVPYLQHQIEQEKLKQEEELKLKLKEEEEEKQQNAKVIKMKPSKKNLTTITEENEEISSYDSNKEESNEEESNEDESNEDEYCVDINSVEKETSKGKGNRGGKSGRGRGRGRGKGKKD